MLLGSMAAYVLARYKFWGNRFIYLLFVSGLAFPVFLALVPLFFVVRNSNLLGTFTGLILVYIAYSLPFTVFFLAAFFKTLPNSVAEAAMIDGCVAHPAVLPGDAADGQARPGQHHDLQHPRPVEPVPAAAGADARHRCAKQMGPHPGHREHPDQRRLTRPTGLGCSPRSPSPSCPMIVMYAIFQRQIQQGLTAGAVK